VARCDHDQRREREVQYQDDYIVRLVEQLGSMMRLAFSRFREGQSSSEPLDVTKQAIQMIVDVDADLFVRFSPQSMVAYLELSGFDDRLVVKLAEALNLQAEILESEGSLVLAGVRREQAVAVLDSIDPERAN
jgi:hypothetical protein